MKIQTKLVYCTNCAKDFPSSSFSTFYESSKPIARVCDKCLSRPSFDSRFQLLTEEIATRREQQNAKLTPMQRNFDKTEYAQKKRELAEKLEDLKMQKLMKEFD